VAEGTPTRKTEPCREEVYMIAQNRGARKVMRESLAESIEKWLLRACCESQVQERYK